MQHRFICLAQGCKGYRLIQEAARLGLQTVLISRHVHRSDWQARIQLDQAYFLESLHHDPDLFEVGAQIHWQGPVSGILALDEKSVEAAARLREHLCLSGMNATQARRFRDKLTMRQHVGVAQPAYSSLLSQHELESFCQRVSPPYYLKPRGEAGSMGIQRIEHPAHLWQAVAALGPSRSHYLVEQAVEGRVFHVDSLVYAGKVMFAQASVYGRSPYLISQHGGVFSSHALSPQSREAQALRSINARALAGLGLESGVVHSEFIQQSDPPYSFVFLEAGARVAGANLDVLVQHTTGINLWREWLRLEVARCEHRPYRPPTPQRLSGGLLTCLARQPHPDLSAYQDQEVCWRLDHLHHAGMVLAGPNPRRIQQVMEEYEERMSRDFLAILPAPKPSR